MYNSLLNKIKYNYRLHKCRRNRKLDNKKIVALAVISLGIIGYKQYEVGTRGLQVVYGDKKIGVVKEKREVIEIVDELEKDLSKKLDKNIKLNQNISFKQTDLKKEKLTEKNEIKKAIEKNLTYSAVGYAIKVNGEEIAYLDTKESAKQALNEYKDSFIHHMEEEGDVKSLEVLEDVSLAKKEVPVEKIDDIDSTISTLKAGNIKNEKHIIESEENFWTLAEDYGLTMEDIEKVNPEKDTKELKAGDEVVIPVTKPILTVVTYEEQKTEKEIDFETTYELDDSIYEDEERVIVEGEKGRTEVDLQIERHNGAEVSEKVLNEIVTKEPITKVISKGTKPVPVRAATGAFIIPTEGRLTSPFGTRWGKPHGGIDIGAPTGEPILASDGGTVTYSQFNSGGYGNMVEINHENGYVTRYAHASKLYVEVGQKVSKGDEIAAIGNTGRSTGPHLHFEIRKNGIPHNPRDYFK